MTSPGGIPGHLVDFIAALRGKGIPVGPSETVDAARALAAVDLLDRDAVREALACSLLHRETHREPFDALFDLWFPSGTGDRERNVREDAGDPPSLIPLDGDGEVDVEALMDLIADLLLDGSPEALETARDLAREMVETMGRYEGRDGAAYSAYQTLRPLSTDDLMKRMLDGLLGADADETERRIAGHSAADMVRGFLQNVADETLRRTAERRGRERVADYAVPRVAEQIDFLRANDTDLQALRRQIGPLARQLGSRLAVRRRRSRAGAIDLRKTLRRSMSTGGVPIDLELKKPRPARPELVVLCDISGSVAGFSHFTLQLVHSLREQFSRVRVFAFIDTTDEVTRFFEAGDDLGVAMARMVREARLVTWDGHSDYGNALTGFSETYGHTLTRDGSLLILGDGRNNYRDPALDALRHIASRAENTHWLNPEPKTQWGTGDSAARAYAGVVPMHECRNVEQLSAVVARLLPV